MSNTKKIIDEMVESGEISKDLEQSINQPKKVINVMDDSLFRTEILEALESIRYNIKIITICIVAPIVISVFALGIYFALKM